jgi:predicted restriction endonuclease
LKIEERRLKSEERSNPRSGDTPIRRANEPRKKTREAFFHSTFKIHHSKSSTHPTNGLALCKNHHWAMDLDIIAPGLDLHWHVSKVLDPRRSNGEKELIELAGKSVLLPKDPAFHPLSQGLNWRFERLSA